GESRTTETVRSPVSLHRAHGLAAPRPRSATVFCRRNPVPVQASYARHRYTFGGSMNFKVRTCAAGIAAAIGCFSQGAAAQPSAGAMLEEIVVTSRRREENLQDVPASVVGLSADDIEVRGVQRIEDLSVMVPN